MKSENEFTKGVNPLCPNDRAWSARDEQSSEFEVNDFLFSLVRLIKPKFIVETGCYLGDGTIAMASGLRSNGFGQIITCDVDKNRVDYVLDRLVEEDLKGVAEAVVCEGTELIRMCKGMVDMFFIDSSPKGRIRGEEIEEALKDLQSLNLILVHDVAPQHTRIRDEVMRIIQKYNLKSIYMNTPRGLYLLQK
jgi:predicted O-methyltransferase YrrM